MPTKRLSVSVPPKVWNEIEKRRGNVTRSRFVTILLEETFFQPEDKAQAKIPTD